MNRSLAFSLHALTARLDRAADRILQKEEGISYARFLALFTVGELGASTQKELARHLGITEPSVSRMTTTLSATGLLHADSDPSGGNRRQLRLTMEGTELVRRCCELLEAKTMALVKASGVPYEGYLRHTDRLLLALDSTEHAANGSSTPQDPPGSTLAQRPRLSGGRS
jgi:DNA-binding MarR family transcriptional regulator